MGYCYSVLYTLSLMCQSHFKGTVKLHRFKTMSTRISTICSSITARHLRSATFGACLSCFRLQDPVALGLVVLGATLQASPSIMCTRKLISRGNIITWALTNIKRRLAPAYDACSTQTGVAAVWSRTTRTNVASNESEAV